MLQNLFTAFKVTNMTELTLGGNAVLSSVKRLHWNTAETITQQTGICLKELPKLTVLIIDVYTANGKVLCFGESVELPVIRPS